MWNHDVSDTKEVERMAALYDEDGTRAVEPGAEVETGRNLVRRCGNELGIATWEVYDFDPDTWMCEAFSNREAAETWFDGHMYLESCAELDHQLTQSVKRMAALAGNMSGGRWTVGVQEYRDGRKSLSFQLSDDAGFFLITSPIGKASELAMGKVRGRVQALRAIAMKFGELEADKDQVIFISHGDCEKDALLVKDTLVKTFGCAPEKIFLSAVGPVIGSHSGPGTVALFFRGKNRG